MPGVGPWLVQTAIPWLRGTSFLAGLSRYLLITAAFRVVDNAFREPAKIATRGTRNVMIRTTTAPRAIVYGEACLSGPIVYANNYGAALTYVIALTGHEIDSYQGFYIEDDFIDIADVDLADPPATSGSAGDGGVVGGKYDQVTPGADLVRMRGHLGHTTEAADNVLTSLFPSDWTAAHQLKGCAYLVAQFWDTNEADSQNLWDGGSPQTIRALVKGSKVYDPRLDSTFPSGSGSHRVDDDTTWEWSDNPALCLANYLMVWAGWDYSKINWQSVFDSADYCDVSVAIPTSSTEKRFTCNGVLYTDNKHSDNIRQILSSFNGRLIHSGDEWLIYVGYQTPSITLTEDNLRDDVTLKTQPEAPDRFNSIRGTFFDPTRSYQEMAFISQSNSTFVTRDNGEELYPSSDLKLTMTNSEYMCQRLAQKLILQSDEQQQVIFPANYTGFQVGVGDTIYLSIDEFGWSSKTFRCVGWKFGDYEGVDLVLQEDQSSAYDDPAEVDYDTRSSTGVIVFSDAEVPAPSDLTATAVLEGILLQWTNPSPTANWDLIEIYGGTTDVWASASLLGTTKSSHFLHQLSDSNTRYYWIRAVDKFNRESLRDPNSDTSTISAAANFTAAISTSVTPQFGQWQYDPNGPTYDPTDTTCDITFEFLQEGSVIATHVIRVTRSGVNLTGATFSESGDATTEDVSVGSGTPTLTITVSHDATGITASYTMVVTQGGTDGTDGTNGTNGTNGEDYWTPNLSANMGKTGKSFSKDGGTDASWSEQVYSDEFYGACAAQWQPHAVTTCRFMIGLNTDPTTDANYTSIDYAWYCNNGTAYIYESGSNIGSQGTYVAGDVFAISYDGNHIRYLLNGAVKRTVANAGQAFALDSSFYDIGAQADFLTFTPSRPGKIDLTTQIYNQLTATFADAGLVNSNITVNADGSLSGAGGGAPTISSLSGSVATGQLTANVLAALQAVIGNLAAIKADIGAITAGSLTIAGTSSAGFIKTSGAGYDSGVGIYLDYNGGSPRLFIGDSSGNKMLFDTSGNLSVSGGIKLLNESTFTPSWSGFSVAPAGDLNYLNLGNLALIWAPADRLGTSDANTCAISSGIPSEIRPSTATHCLVGAMADANGTLNVYADALVNTDGSLTFGLLTNSATYHYYGVTTAWTNPSSYQGMFAGSYILYPLI